MNTETVCSVKASSLPFPFGMLYFFLASFLQTFLFKTIFLPSTVSHSSVFNPQHVIYLKKSDGSSICLQACLHIQLPALHFHLSNVLSNSYSSYTLPPSETNDRGRLPTNSSLSTGLASLSSFSVSSRHKIFDLYFSFPEDSGYSRNVC